MTEHDQSDLYEKDDNMNDHLIAFTNGTYDPKTNEIMIDSESKCTIHGTGYMYQDSDTETIKEVNQLIEMIFPDKKESEYVISAISYCLKSYNPEQVFFIWKGEENSGMELLIELISYTLGEYFNTLDTSYFTKKSRCMKRFKSTLKNSRIVVSTKLESCKKLSVPHIKELCGGDQQLMEDWKYFRPKFKLIIPVLGNDEIMMDSYDRGIELRSRFVLFSNKILDHDDLMLKLRTHPIKYGLAFFHILMDHRVKNNKLIVPERFADYTSRYFLSKKSTHD